MKTTTANILERLLWTAIAAGLAAVPITLSLTSNGVSIAGYSLLTAAIAAAISFLKNVLLLPPPFVKGPLGIIERMLWTGLQAFVGSLPATITLSGHNLSALGYSGLLAAVAAMVSFAKNLTIFPVTPTSVNISAPLAPVLAPVVPVGAPGVTWGPLQVVSAPAPAPKTAKRSAKKTVKRGSVR